MKNVSIYIIANYREGKTSPWEVLFLDGKNEKTLVGEDKANSAVEISMIAFKKALGCLTFPCHVSVYADPEGLRDLVMSDKSPEMINKLMNNVIQLIWLKPNDVMPEVADMKRRLQYGSYYKKKPSQSPIYLVFQPIVRLSDMSIVAYESLMRFSNRPPSDTPLIISSLENRGYSSVIDKRVTRELFLYLNDINFAIKSGVHLNLSAQSISSLDFSDWFHLALGKIPDPTRLTIEITETARISDPFVAIDFAEKSLMMGVSLSIDDYGTGNATEKTLKMLPFENIKIDGSFITSWKVNPESLEFVRHVVEIARATGATTTAEFIEDEEDFLIARHLGVDFGQGYYFGAPQKTPSKIIVG
jgi:EAL domain-containing protein (putative c-di-GMP-specific phosphodiesterase class I)